MAADSDDEDVKAAIAMSLAEPQPAANGIENDGMTADTHPRPTLSAILGMNRKAMEAERLARHSRKRERSISPPPMSSSRKVPKLEAETVTLPSGAMLRSFSTTVDQSQQERKSEAANAANRKLRRSPSPRAIKAEPSSESSNGTRAASGTIKYPRGVVKKTWAYRHERTGDDIKLEEVLEPQTLKTAVLSAFQWDTNWVLAKLKTPLTGGSTKCAFVMQAKEDSLREEMRARTADYKSFLRLCFPSMEGQVHCMHSKLMLLFHAEKLRIAIPSANLLEFDWGESGVMENSVFMIDLPRLPKGSKTESDDLTSFAKELLYFLAKQDLNDDIRAGVLNFDFSATTHIAFVHTVGGAHYGEDAERTGLPGLARAVREHRLQTDDNLEIDFAASSIGSLNDDYLRNVHAAARGEDMFARAAKTSSKPKADFFKPQKASASSKPAAPERGIRQKLRIYFPTYDTVTSSTAGAAGTICLSRKWYESSPFPRQCFRDYKSTRKGLLSHNKILYARGRKKYADGKEPTVKEDVAWVYHGSANMSESAWGKVLLDSKTKKPKINCRNWECGVLLPVPREVLDVQSKKAMVVKKESIEGEDSETESEDEGNPGGDELVGFEVFDGIVKPPCKMPGEKFEGKQPWYFQEQRR